MTGRIVPDLPDAEYHAHPALSSTGIRAFMRAPAHYAHERANGRKPKTEFDEGRAAHAVVLGQPRTWTVAKGPDGPLKDRRGNAWKAEAERAAAHGLDLLLQSQVDNVEAMAVALDRSPAEPLLTAVREHGAAELSLFADDPDTGVPMRARLDGCYLAGDVLVVVDYKTAGGELGAAPWVFARKSAKPHRYDVQQAFYERLIRACYGDDVRIEFVFVAQEKDPPYLASPIRLDPADVALADLHIANALVRFAECSQAGDWPGYATDITTVTLPHYATD